VTTGVDLRRQRFLVAQSWGPGWSTIVWRGYRLRGYATIPFDVMGRLLASDGEAAIPEDRRAG
jgi:hypothetical protein